jgi:hypothetical protein
VVLSLEILPLEKETPSSRVLRPATTDGCGGCFVRILQKVFRLSWWYESDPQRVSQAMPRRVPNKGIPTLNVPHSPRSSWYLTCFELSYFSNLIFEKDLVLHFERRLWVSIWSTVISTLPQLRANSPLEEYIEG